MESLEELTLELRERVTRTEAALAEATERQRLAEEQASVDRRACQRAERRFRVFGGLLIGALTLTCVFPILTPALAQGALTLEELAARITALESKTSHMSQIIDPNTNQPTVRFSDVNLQVVSGSGSTLGTANGRGNLIVGYNEFSFGSIATDRTGSHNLILGSPNNYTASAKGGMVSGQYCGIGGSQAMVLGGLGNFIYSDSSVIAGGAGNLSYGYGSTIAGGSNNQTSYASSYASIFGGSNNKGNGSCSSVMGGNSNTASGSGASVSGGASNTASGSYASVSGGAFNVASGYAASISAGWGSVAQGQYSSVSGGKGHPANGDYSSVSGGYANTANGAYSSISGGSGKVASSTYQWVGGSYHTP